MELCSRGGLLCVHPKSHNVPHQLGMGSVTPSINGRNKKAKNYIVS